MLNWRLVFPCSAYSSLDFFAWKITISRKGNRGTLIWFRNIYFKFNYRGGFVVFCSIWGELFFFQPKAFLMEFQFVIDPHRKKKKVSLPLLLLHYEFENINRQPTPSEFVLILFLFSLCTMMHGNRKSN